jgi:hypothetical protein
MREIVNNQSNEGDQNSANDSFSQIVNSLNIANPSNNQPVRSSVADVINSKLTNTGSEMTGQQIDNSDKSRNNSYNLIPDDHTVPMDPRLSIDFSLINNPYKIIPTNLPQQSFGDFQNTSFELNRSLYNPSMSTLRFMNEIDLRCDDHLIQYKEDMQATRYCTDCKTLCCDSCVIEFHSTHIAAAKTRIEDYFKKQKNEMEDLKVKLNSSIKHKTVLAELNTTFDNHEKSITNFFLKRKNYLESLKNKIDALLLEDNELALKVRETVNCFYKEECYTRIDKPLKDLEDLLDKIQFFIRDWDGFSRAEKARSLKMKTLVQFKTESDELNDIIKGQIEVFKGKSKSLEKNIGDLFKNFSYNDKITEMESILMDISGKIKNSFSSVIKLNYDEIAIEDPSNKAGNVFNLISGSNNDDYNIVVKEDSNNFNIKNSNNNDIPSLKSIQNNFQSNNVQPNVQPYLQPNPQPNIQPPANNNIHVDNNVINNNDNNSFENRFGSSSNNKPLNVGDLNIKPQMHISDNNSYINSNKNNDLIIGIKPKSDEIIIFDPRKQAFKSEKINKGNFQDPTKIFTTFPDNCRYVNLYSSILITGGYLNRQVTSNCYILVLSPKDYNSYDISIIQYGNMIESRERHNIINLPDRNMVLVCSGFFNKNVEMTDLNVGTWTQFAPLNEIRANATIAYINKKFVFILGGFKINDKQQGEYQNSYEVLNLDKKGDGWKLFSFDQFGSIKLSAMGVINVNENTLLLCGGYDGAQYKTDVYKMEVDNQAVKKYEKVTNLPSNLIFIHNGFMRIDDFGYNYDLNMNIVIYNPKENSFKVNKSLN